MAYTANFQFSLPDYQVLTRTIQSRQKYGKWTFFIYMSMTTPIIFNVDLLFDLIFYNIIPNRPNALRAVLFPVAFTLIFSAMYWLVTNFSVISRVHFNRMMIANQTVSYIIDDDGIALSIDGFSNRLAWRRVDHFLREPNSIVLFFSKMEGTILPKRGFESTETFEAVSRFIEAKVAAQTAAKV